MTRYVLYWRPRHGRTWLRIHDEFRDARAAVAGAERLRAIGVRGDYKVVKRRAAK